MRDRSSQGITPSSKRGYVDRRSRNADMDSSSLRWDSVPGLCRRLAHANLFALCLKHPKTHFLSSSTPVPPCHFSLDLTCARPQLIGRYMRYVTSISSARAVECRGPGISNMERLRLLGLRHLC